MSPAPESRSTPGRRRRALLVATFLVPAVAALASSARSLALGHQARGERDRVRTSLEACMETIAAGAEEGWAQALRSSAPRARVALTEAGVDGEIEVHVVVDETLGDRELGTQLGLPRDLDGDGSVSSVDVRERAQLLPVVLVARWAGVLGPCEERLARLVVGG